MVVHTRRASQGREISSLQENRRDYFSRRPLADSLTHTFRLFFFRRPKSKRPALRMCYPSILSPKRPGTTGQSSSQGRREPGGQRFEQGAPDRDVAGQSPYWGEHLVAVDHVYVSRRRRRNLRSKKLCALSAVYLPTILSRYEDSESNPKTGCPVCAVGVLCWPFQFVPCGSAFSGRRAERFVH